MSTPGARDGAPPFVLFVPSYGRGGSGEFVRSVTLAQAVARRWPQLRIEFLLPGGPGTRRDAPFPKHCHEGPDEAKGTFDNEHIERLRPDLVVFDSGCRSSTLRLCRRLGIRSVYISDRDGVCRKAFRLDWLWLLDEHWHQREHLTGPAFTISQRLRGALGRTRRTLFDTYYPELPPAADELPPALATALERPFVLLSPGGGGYRIDGRPVAEAFVETAEAIHARTGLECLTLLGPLHEGEPTNRLRTHSLRAVTQAQFLALMRRARLVVTNGGGSLHQALACGAATVVAPLGGSDQPERIGKYAAAGLVRAAEPQAAALAAAALALLEDDAQLNALRARVAALSVVNGIPMMCVRLAAMLALPA